MGTKTDRGMIWLILGFLLTNGPWLLFFALFEYKPGWVQHEGPSLLLFYIGTVARIQSGGSSAPLCPAHCSTTIVCWLCAVVAGRGGRGFVAKVCIFQNNCHSPASTSYICTFCCHSNVDRQKYSRIFCKGGENVGR